MGKRNRKRTNRVRTRRHTNDVVHFRSHTNTLNHDPCHMFVLGMHASMPRDKARLQTLQVEQNAKITTVSKCSVDYQLKGFNHLDINFKTQRGAASIQGEIATLYKKLHDNNEPMKIIVLLDYFWLQKDYYIHCYGTSWLTQHAPMFLNVGASQVILPIDRRYESGVLSNMESMLEQWQHEGAKDMSAVFIKTRTGLRTRSKAGSMG